MQNRFEKLQKDWENLNLNLSKRKSEQDLISHFVDEYACLHLEPRETFLWEVLAGHGHWTTGLLGFSAVKTACTRKEVIYKGLCELR